MSAGFSAVSSDLPPELVRRWEKLRRAEQRRETRQRLWALYGQPLRGWRLVAVILGFIIWWPVGLALLGYFFWRSDRMSCHSAPWTAWKARAREALRGAAGPFQPSPPSSGNLAFDAYRESVLRRLEEERRALDAQAAEFAAFLHDLRRAKDQEEFDRFMASRRQG